MDINLKMKNQNGEVLEFEGIILNSNDTELKICFHPYEELSNINYGTRFIIGDIFPRAYKVIGINEFATNTTGRIGVTFTLSLDQIRPNYDDLETKIAYNVN